MANSSIDQNTLVMAESLNNFKEIIKERQLNLELPFFDKINVKSLQIFRKRVPKLDPSTDYIPDVTDDFSFVFSQNKLIKVNVPEEYLAKGVIITDLLTAFSKYREQFLPYFARAISFEEDSLTYQHYQSVNNGVFIYIPKGANIKDTLQAYFSYVSDQCESIHVVLVVDDDSKLVMVENHVSDKTCKGDYTYFLESYVKNGANLAHVVNNQSRTTGHNYFYRKFLPSDKAEVILTDGEFAEGNELVNNKIILEGNDSVGEVKTVAIAQDDQTMAINIHVQNKGLRTKGNILQHGVILDLANLIFNGIGQIVRGARGSDSQQENRVLMLSPKARGDANPILLINENDVTAGHAASVGRIDEEQLYYLESRGLDADKAKRLIIKGFLESVITTIESKKTRQMLRLVIERKLGIDKL